MLLQSAVAYIPPRACWQTASGVRTEVANEAFARVKIDQLLKDAGWKLTDGQSVRFEYPLDDGGKADYALFNRQGRALAVLEAKSTSVNLRAGEVQGKRYADQLGSRSPPPQ